MPLSEPKAGGSIDSHNPQPDAALLQRITDVNTDILLVGFGAPKQESWIHAATAAAIPVMIGIGGTFGFYSTKKRAPRWLRALRLEWLWRACTEPGHWKRIIQAVLVFPLRALLWTLGRISLRGKDSK